MDYLDFKISVEHVNGQEYKISASSDQGGELAVPSIFPYDEAVLAAKLQSIRKSLNAIRTRAIGRRKPAEEQIKLLSDADLQEFGSKLFQFLFHGSISSSYHTVLGVAGVTDGKGVRIKLRFAENAAQLAPIPWEFLYDHLRRDYVTLDHKTAFVRYLDLPRAVQPLKVKQPLKILGMISNPLNDLDVEKEKKWVEDALSDLVESKKVKLGWVEGDTHQQLQSAMRQDDWHVFHYIGHAGFDPIKNGGFLLLGDERNPGKGKEVPAKGLARLIRSEDFRLVVLNACEGATSDSQDLFSSTASTLLADGIPAVLAMQYPITDDSAIDLARSFYQAVADGSAVDCAITDARIGISLSFPEYLEWATPVLFMRSKDGRLFDVETLEPVQPLVNVIPTPDPTPIEPVVDLPPSDVVLKLGRMEMNQLIDSLFNIDELKTLSDNLGVDAEDLGYSGKGGLIRELVKYLKRRRKTDDLVNYLVENHRAEIEADHGRFGTIHFTG